jgi:sulfur carrier protein
MNILCNDLEQHIKANTLDKALVELGYANAVVATALNGEFVPKGKREHTTLKAGDHIEIVAPMQGG